MEAILFFNSRIEHANLICQCYTLTIKEQFDDWGLADTEVREQIYAHIGRHGL